MGQFMMEAHDVGGAPLWPARIKGDVSHTADRDSPSVLALLGLDYCAGHLGDWVSVTAEQVALRG